MSDLSEEEKTAIEILKEYSEKDVPCDSCRYCSEKPNVTKSVREIINLIEKKQKEIEELHKERNKLVNPSNLQFSYFDNKSQIRVVINGFVSKDKIREKIKELEKEIHIVIPNKYNRMEVITEYKNEGAIDILQELLLGE